MSESEKIEILIEMRDRQKAAFELQKQQFELVKSQFDRAERIQEKAEQLQNNATRAFKFILPLIALLLVIVFSILWQIYS